MPFVYQNNIEKLIAIEADITKAIPGVEDDSVDVPEYAPDGDPEGRGELFFFSLSISFDDGIDGFIFLTSFPGSYNLHDHVVGQTDNGLSFVRNLTGMDTDLVFTVGVVHMYNTVLNDHDIVVSLPFNLYLSIFFQRIGAVLLAVRNDPDHFFAGCRARKRDCRDQGSCCKYEKK